VHVVVACPFNSGQAKIQQFRPETHAIAAVKVNGHSPYAVCIREPFLKQSGMKSAGINMGF
jgi:hypothetical protein